MKRTLLATALAVAIFGVSACSSDGDAAATGPSTPSATRTPRATASASPSASATTAIPVSTTTATNPPAQPPANPPAQPPPPPPPPPPDNTQACATIGDAMYSYLQAQIAVMSVLQFAPNATDEAKQQALQQFRATLNTVGGQLRQGANQTSEPELKSAANTWADAMARLQGAGDAAAIRAITDAPALYAATATFDQFCA